MEACKTVASTAAAARRRGRTVPQAQIGLRQVLPAIHATFSPLMFLSKFKLIARANRPLILKDVGSLATLGLPQPFWSL